MGGPIAGGLMTYRAHGVQNVAVVSGCVGIYNTVAPALRGGNPTVSVFFECPPDSRTGLPIVFPER